MTHKCPFSHYTYERWLNMDKFFAKTIGFNSQKKIIGS